jgi:predicted site-specific integrase-resolvase
MAERLSEWAARKRIHPKTAYLMHTQGRMPVPTERFSERVILVHDPDFTNGEEQTTTKTIIYTRVDTAEQETELNAQTLRLLETVTLQQLHVDEIIKEIGLGTEDKRPLLNKILADRGITTIIIENEKILTQHGFNLVKNVLKAQNRKIVVLGK